MGAAIATEAKGARMGKLVVGAKGGVMATKPGFNSRVFSVTNEEILRFWRQRHYEEEDHLLDALKAAARIRAQNLTENDNKRFEESLAKELDAKTSDTLRLGIKDWWTRSNYAYLNQPSIA